MDQVILAVKFFVFAASFLLIEEMLLRTLKGRRGNKSDK